MRLLKKTAAVYLLLLFLDRPLRVADAARLLEINRRTARSHLLSLASLGLLVTILESGASAPPLNANRHLKGCGCQECRMLKYRVCPHCGEYPCACGEAED